MDDEIAKGKDEEATLPKATVSKLIKDMLPEDIRCSNDARDLILECCVEFIQLISSEANEMCNKDSKKTIAAEHVIKALKNLGFDDYVDGAVEVYDKHKEEAQERPKGVRRLEDTGISKEELLRQQQMLFAKARSTLSSGSSSFQQP
eukprot:CAMPEP_0184349934 /NCGR_PEP_ID=MMETSP1089-20130417/37367_1 /TAXON_ID=38269 ORGANISM="Gloeochaete wittrockiana, Strain SAG46.84" /NCGR_SAMPLE_ID=MMETSP1089 /ASSEMBLY_ACC=CAM_ASM_000445 /LENGTH=146 /DNA_ID=CAMNT_0026682455 /DNA_START=20 /DNA_END=460 /DNA_ORIENTATION=-